MTKVNQRERWRSGVSSDLPWEMSRQCYGSFHYAGYVPLLGGEPRPPEEVGRLSSWAERWNTVVAARFLESYFEIAATASYLPESREEVQRLLNLHLFERAIYELGYELNNRPTYVGIPLQGIASLLSSSDEALRRSTLE